MKKGIRISAINGVAKKAALGAMLASSVAMFASNPIKTARTDNPPQTEVVSKDGAEALKVMTFPGQQQNPGVPTVHNKALDEKCLKFCDNDQERKEMIEYLSSIYETNGSYLGSAMVQQNLDLNMFLAFLDGNIDILKNFEGDYRITDNSSVLGSYYEVAQRAYNKIPKTKEQIEDLKNKVDVWISQNYFNIYTDAFSFDHPPDYDEVINSMQNFIKNNTLELTPGNPMFKNVKFKEKDNGIAYTKQDYMDFIAINTHNMNVELFRNILKLYYNPVYNELLYRNLDAFLKAAAPQ